MNAIEIQGLTKSFRGLYAVDHLDMTVPVGAIYGFIGENGSGKSTTMKLICGHLVADGGKIRLFDRRHTDAGVRSRVGALIENAGCFPSSSIYQNLKMQAINLGLANADDEIYRVLAIVRMEDEARLPFRKCSLGMKQRVGIAMALLGDPALLILDEPINGLDTDGMRIMREILLDITHTYGCTVLISSHILGELEKIATHYGIIRRGHMVQELSAAGMESRARVFCDIKTRDLQGAYELLARTDAPDVRLEGGVVRVYGVADTEALTSFLMSRGQVPYEVRPNKIGLEEYYLELMSRQEA